MTKYFISFLFFIINHLFLTIVLFKAELEMSNFARSPLARVKEPNSFLSGCNRYNTIKCLISGCSVPLPKP